jgi:hypothetical protein
MKKWILAIAFLATIVATHLLTRYLVDRPESDPSVTAASLHSAILNEERPYRVRLPESYGRDGARRYPVLYVLDGSSQDVHTAESAALLARIEAMPEVIVVGIPNVSDESRERDLTPSMKADSFLAFLEKELIPRIEKDYRTSRPRMLAGNSRGGLFVVHSLLRAPSLFDARFAHSPALWRDDSAIVRQLDAFLAKPSPSNTFLFLSLGDGENPKMTAAYQQAVAVLKRRAPQTLRWQSEITRGATHGNNASLATPVGLHAMFGKRLLSSPP